MKTFYGISGLPRTGSTLLSAILSQNPDIHAEGLSALCQLLWDTQFSCDNYAKDAFWACDKEYLRDVLLNELPETYYRQSSKPIVIDKCRSWTLPANLKLFKNYVNSNPKIVVLVRPVAEIVSSFVSLRKANGWDELDLESDLFEDGSEPLMRSLAGVEWARKNNNGEFLFVSYDELVNDTKSTLEKIYSYYGLPYFEHDLFNIEAKTGRIDGKYNLVGLHDIRRTVSKRKIEIELSDQTMIRCNQLDFWSMYAAS